MGEAVYSTGLGPRRDAASHDLRPDPAVPAAPEGPRPAPGRPLDAGAAEPLWWSRLAIGLVVAGYATVVLHGLFRAIDRTSEIVTTGVTAVAFALSRRHPRLASALTIVTVWAEVTWSVFHTPIPRTSGMLVYPVLATAAGFLLGGGEAIALAVCTVVALVGDATIDGTWRAGAAGDTPHWMLVASLVTVGSALVARAVRRSYATLLRRSEEARRRYANLFASAPDGLVAVGPDGGIVEANPAAAMLLGTWPAALHGTAIAAALRAAGASGEVDLAAAASPGAPLLVTLERGEGRRAVEISARAAEGEAGPSLLVLRDVTQRRLVEERLGHAQRLESVGQLAGGVAHDFNNVLVAISAGAESLAGHADPQVRELAGEIAEAGLRGTALTQQLLAFARRDPVSPERLDLAGVVSGMSRLLARVLGPGQRLALDAPAAVPVVADRAQLEQVAMNLVANAHDAMPGGGTVQVATRLLDRATAAALGSTVGAERQALLEVRDTGTGIRPEVQPRIFEPFFSTKPRGEGTGLGLATVHGIAARSGGMVAVDSAPGRGATFRVFLPAAPEP